MADTTQTGTILDRIVADKRQELEQEREAMVQGSRTRWSNDPVVFAGPISIPCYLAGLKSCTFVSTPQNAASIALTASFRSVYWLLTSEGGRKLGSLVAIATRTRRFLTVP